MFGGTPPGTRTRNLRINSPKISVRGVHTPGLGASRRVSASVQSIVCGLVRWVCVPLCPVKPVQNVEGYRRIVPSWIPDA
jgi:hypothetical protein